jgi:hypothetical protein
MRTAVSALALLLAGCAAFPPAGVPVTGEWGGVHVGLTLSASGGRLEYDCAAGTIGPVVPGPDGHFRAEGMHMPAAGGPDIEGQQRPAVPVAYAGSVRGDRMSLAGRLENGVSLGPFELRRGGEPIIMRCL